MCAAYNRFVCWIGINSFIQRSCRKRRRKFSLLLHKLPQIGGGLDRIIHIHRIVTAYHNGLDRHHVRISFQIRLDLIGFANDGVSPVPFIGRAFKLLGECR